VRHEAALAELFGEVLKLCRGSANGPRGAVGPARARPHFINERCGSPPPRIAGKPPVARRLGSSVEEVKPGVATGMSEQAHAEPWCAWGCCQRQMTAPPTTRIRSMLTADPREDRTVAPYGLRLPRRRAGARRADGRRPSIPRPDRRAGMRPRSVREPAPPGARIVTSSLSDATINAGSAGEVRSESIRTDARPPAWPSQFVTPQYEARAAAIRTPAWPRFQSPA
jgi:hypothetical protein